MHKFELLLDSDGVVVDMITPWVTEYNRLYKDCISVAEFGADWGNMHERVKPECGEAIYDIYARAGFFESLPPLAGAIDGLKYLNSKHHLYIVTSYSGEPHAAAGKVAWYREHCPFLDVSHQVVLCHPKFLMDGDILVDDSVCNLEKWAKRKLERGEVPMTIAMQATHNKDAVLNDLVNSVVPDFEHLVQQIDFLAGL